MFYDPLEFSTKDEELSFLGCIGYLNYTSVLKKTLFWWIFKVNQNPLPQLSTSILSAIKVGLHLIVKLPSLEGEWIVASGTNHSFHRFQGTHNLGITFMYTWNQNTLGVLNFFLVEDCEFNINARTKTLALQNRHYAMPSPGTRILTITVICNAHNEKVKQNGLISFWSNVLPLNYLG